MISGFIKAVGLAALAFGISACEDPGAAGGKATFSVPLTQDFEGFGVRWFDDRGNFFYLWDVIDRDGELHLCGVGFYEDSQRRGATNEALRSHSFRIAGREIYRGTGHFKKVANEEELVRSQATCRGTGVPTPTGPYTVQVLATKSQFQT